MKSSLIYFHKREDIFFLERHKREDIKMIFFQREKK